MVPHSSAWEGAYRRQSQKPVTTYGTQVRSATNTVEKEEDAACATRHKRTGDISYHVGR
jgi:hypothetical protein